MGGLGMQTKVLCLFIGFAFATGGCAPIRAKKAEFKRRGHQLGVTGAGQALSRVTFAKVDEFYPAISPDGKTLLFSVVVFDTARLAAAERIPASTVRSTLWMDGTIAGVDPDTGARRTLFTPTSHKSGEPAWLPDGSAFIYSSDAPGQFSLVRALSNSPNSAIKVLVNGEVAPWAHRPTVSPDGTKIAFGTVIRNQFQLGIANMDGSQFTLIGEGTHPAWSPDGTRIAFTRVVGARSHIFLTDAGTGQNLVQITSGDTNNIQPAWSPDGEVLVFASNRGWNTRKGGSERGTWNLFVLKTDGTGLTQLTDGDGRSDSPVWGLDGWVYFASNQAKFFDIWRVKPVGELAH